jgi:hypothetical protein
MFAMENLVYAFPMVSKAQSWLGYQNFVDDIGVPNVMVTDGDRSEMGPKSKMRQLANQLHTQMRVTEPYSPWQNLVNNHIRELEKRWQNTVRTKKVHRRLWDYGLVWECEIMNRIARGTDERPGLEQVTGDSVDISEWLDFDFYDYVWYWDKPHLDVSKQNPKLGCWLGVSHRVGSDMCYWVLNENGNVLSRTTVQHVTDDDAKQESIKKQLTEFDEKLDARLNDTNFVVDNAEAEGFFMEDVGYDDIDEMVEENAVEQDDYTEETYDQYIGAEVMVTHGDEKIRGKVVKRAKGEDGNPIGRRHQNTLLDTREYVVELPDGTTAEYVANVIAENMYSQCDSEGMEHLLLKEIVNHRKDDTAYSIDDGWVHTRGGRRSRRQTTKGWWLLVEWKDGTTSWIPLKELKASFPIELAEYAVANKIVEEPAFAWWVKDVLRKRNRIIAKLKSRYWKTTHKFGIRLPHSVEEALRIDEETGTDLWRKAVEKEMKNVMPAFELWEDGTVADARSGKKLVGYQEVSCHTVFDIKMADFTRKARFVAGGHQTKPPPSITYSSVVSRDSVRLAFLIAALNDLDVMSCDLQNAYLNADCREKIFVVAGPEFGSKQGCVFIVRKALYGLKSAGAAWRALFSEMVQAMGFKNTKADPDVYIRAQTKPNGFEYYEMLLVYVDDVLTLSHAPQIIMDEIGRLFTVKKESIGVPTRYLGANVGKFQLPDGRETWYMSSHDYVLNAVKIIEDILAEEGMKLKGKADRPFPQHYRPEVDVSKELEPYLVQRYQQLMGILRWMVERGRVDIQMEVSMLASHNVLPREGHLEAVYHIFAYLKNHENSKVVFDDAMPEIDERKFTKADWKDFYGDMKEAIPPNAPEPRGNYVHVSAFVDVAHAGNLVTRRSHTGVLIFVNKALITWYSKRQNTVETSTFGSEFVAMRVGLELIEALRYKLRMFGVPIDGPASVFCDNGSVVNNTTLPESTLAKKHNAICYHRVREAVHLGARNSRRH